MRSKMRAFIHAATVLAENPGLTIAQLMRAARCSSGIAQRVIAEVSEPAVILPVAVPAETGVQNDGASSASDIAASPPDVDQTVDQTSKHASGRPPIGNKAMTHRAGAEVSDMPHYRNVTEKIRDPRGRQPEGDKALTPAEEHPRAVSRARALVREQLKHGPRPGAQVEAAAQAAEISKYSLIAATDALGVRTRKGQWWLPR